MLRKSGERIWSAAASGIPRDAALARTGRGTSRPTCPAPFVVVGALLDLPFSLLFDTIFLPADISRHREMKKTDEADKSSKGSREGRKQPRGASSASFEDKIKQE
ncbi:MAG: YceK/YidQ family lipoprotein [Saccharofermentanales bacterium]